MLKLLGTMGFSRLKRVHDLSESCLKRVSLYKYSIQVQLPNPWQINNETSWDNKDCFPAVGKQDNCLFSLTDSTLDSQGSCVPTDSGVTWRPNDAAVKLN